MVRVEYWTDGGQEAEFPEGVEVQWAGEGCYDILVLNEEGEIIVRLPFGVWRRVNVALRVESEAGGGGF